MPIPEQDRQAVFNACEALEQETVDLIAELVKIPSENPGYKYDEKLYRETGSASARRG